MKKPIAILTADWHIWGTSPLFRAAEEDWFSAMRRPLRQIRRFQKKNNDIPILIAGDIFDRYNPPPETVNWLMKNMPPNCYAIPGQHDLQNHNLELIEKTGFQTLVEGGKLQALNAWEDAIIDIDDFELQIAAKPWEQEREIPKKEDGVDCLLYLAHQYVYCGQGTHYQGVTSDHDIKKLKEILNEVDIAVFGDNHIPWESTLKKTKIFNCGTLLRRKVDEREYRTGFGVLFDNKTVERIFFDTEDDKFSQCIITHNDQNESNKITAELLEELEKLDTISADFRVALERELDRCKCSKTVKQISKEILDNYEVKK